MSPHEIAESTSTRESVPSSPISSCWVKNFAGALQIIVVERAIGEARQRDPSPAGIAGFLGHDVGIAEELVALAARVLERQETIEPDGGVDNLAVEALGAGGSMRESSQDDGELEVLIGILGDGFVESAEVLVGEGIEHCRVSNLVQGTLHRSPALDDLASELQDDAAVPVRSTLAAEPIN